MSKNEKKVRKVIYGLLIAVLMIGCNSSDSWDCVKSTGDIHQEEISLGFFNKLDVRHRVQLIVKQGFEQKVVLETGESLSNKISITVKDSILRMENNNTCNQFRDYGATKVFVTTPHLVEIRNGSGSPVIGEGILNYKRLNLISENTNFEEEIHTVGDFELNIDVDKLNVVTNGNSIFYIKGEADQASIGFYGGISRFEGKELMIQDLRVFHRSSNDIIVNPQSAIRGEIVSVGNVICSNRPAFVEVEESWEGRLIFRD